MDPDPLQPALSADPAAGRCVVIGAGPAGLTAAWEAQRQGLSVTVLEKDAGVGGISRTVVYRGYRFDIGGHRFLTKVDRVRDLWHEILGSDFLTRDRLSRIYYEDRFFDYPLRPLNALRGLGPVEAVRIGLSYLRARLFPLPEERSFEQWVVNRFGRRLFAIFFEAYTEKVWGMPCSEIASDWAAQRIKNLDLMAAVRDALLGSGSRPEDLVISLIERFEYPRLGPGMLWERARDVLEEQGVPTWTESEVLRIRHDGARVQAVTVRRANGECQEVEGEHFLSSMPLRELLGVLEPAPPAPVVEAANRLKYRDFLTVALIVDRSDLFPDNWIYIHSPKVRVGRIQNFKNWSPDMVPDPARTALGLEYFVQEGDDLWSADDSELIALARDECALLGLVRPEEVIDGTVVRVQKAYPVYDPGYRDAIGSVRRWLEGLENLQCLGRNGQHRYNNQDHSMLTAMLAVENLLGASHDVWDVNVEGVYHEERVAGETPGDRAVPRPIGYELEEAALLEAFARYDPIALGAAIGSVCGIGIFLATAVLLLAGHEPVGPTLSLLDNYLIGYRVSWPGAFFGMLEASIGGFAFGILLARTINTVTGWHENWLAGKIQLARSLDPLDE